MGFIEQAYNGKNDWWRYLLSFVVVFLGWQFIGIIPLFIVAFRQSEDMEELLLNSQNAFADLGIDSNLYLFAILLTFVFGLMALLFSVKQIHLRSIRSLVTSRERIDWSRIAFGFTLWFLVSVMALCFDYMLSPENYIFNFKPVPFFILVGVAVFLIPLQTSFEELLFRGYLMQGVGLWFKNALVPFLFTSIGFGLMHAFNPEVDKLGSIILVFYIGTGILFGLITLLDQGTELALGMHAANNIVAAVFVTVNWSAFQTEALFIDNSEPSLSVYMFFPVFVIYPLVVWYLSRKYAWTDWKHKLTGRISIPEKADEN